jgi:hypothetical protein
MGAGIGAEAAERVRKMREEDATRIAQLDRDDRIFNAESIPFFEAVASLLRENAVSFNADLNLEGKNALTFVFHPGLIELGKQTNPTLLRRAVHLQPNHEVMVRTETLIHYRVGTKQEKWRFAVEHGELLLNGMSVLECATALFEGIAEAFR